MRFNSGLVPTIGTGFDERRNSLNAIRLLLAMLVIGSHTWPIGGYGSDPSFGGRTLGDWAVAGFFSISGYLIFASRMRARSLADYLWRRFLRIYPAFVVVLFVVAFGFAPIVAAFTGDGKWSFTEGAVFVLHNFMLEIRQYGIGTTLSTVPYVHVWDGSLWTLFYEFVCYLAIGAGVTIIPAKGLPFIIVAFLIGCTALTVAFEVAAFPAPTTVRYLALLGSYFGAGSLLYCLKEYIPLSLWGAVFSVIIIVLFSTVSISEPFAALPVAYLMLYAGARIPLHRIGAANDVSYGMYIYAFPVQQVLVYIFPSQRLPALVFAILSVACTLPFAWGSWILVERSAMRLKSTPPWARWSAQRGVAGKITKS